MPAPILATVLGSLCALHLYWALGGKWAILPALPKTAAGEPVFTPRRAATLAVAAALACASALTPWTSFRWHSEAMHGMAIVLAFRVIGDFRYVGWFKRVRGTDFAALDTWVYSPLCLLLASLAWISG